MLQTASQLLPELPLFLMTAVATHLVMSFAQTLKLRRRATEQISVALSPAARMANAGVIRGKTAGTSVRASFPIACP